MIRRYSPLISLFVFAALLALGIWAGDVSSVWHKAVTVCLSCMGIG